LNSNIQKYFSPNAPLNLTDESGVDDTEITDSLFGGFKQGGASFNSKTQIKNGD
jgi:hypothetical protein